MSLIQSQRGFTLIEIVVVIVVLGIMALMGSFGLERAMDGYNLARENSQISQKAQIALDRLAIELSHIPFNGGLSRYAISAGTAGSLTYTANIVGVNEVHTITQVNDQLRLDNLPLTDLVHRQRPPVHLSQCRRSRSRGGDRPGVADYSDFPQPARAERECYPHIQCPRSLAELIRNSPGEKGRQGDGRPNKRGEG